MTRSLAAAALVLAGAWPAGAIELPIGTPLSVRLTTGVSTRASHPGDAVSSMLIAPVEIDGQTVLPAGWALRGVVSEVGRLAGRSTLKLDFSQLVDGDDESQPIATRLASVDNSRETVADDGTILGPRPKRRLPSPVAVGLMLLVDDSPVALAALVAGRLVLRSKQHTEIDYPAGVELTLDLSAALELPPPPPPDPQPALAPSLADLARSVPFRTEAPRRHRDADVTNLLFVGAGPQLEHVFLEAGWTRAQPSCLRARLHGLMALVLKHSDPSAPVSRLELAGRPPDLVFEKQTDTLAQRHHVRLWCLGELDGEPVWVAAATHDVGIGHVSGLRVTHRIDPFIDAERQKIVNDLRLTGEVAATALVDRAQPMQGVADATGRPIQTDGLMAVVALRPPAPATALRE
jgi:hypothetical protein